MDLGYIEHSFRAEHLVDHPGPPGKVGEPVEGADPGVDDIEAATAERTGGVEDVGTDELGVEAAIAGQPGGHLDGIR